MFITHALSAGASHPAECDSTMVPLQSHTGVPAPDVATWKGHPHKHAMDAPCMLMLSLSHRRTTCLPIQQLATMTTVNT